MIELGNGWMHALKNANHFSVARHQYEMARDFETGNQTFIAAMEALRTAFTAEDTAYKKL